jgi:hypothetical protein
VRAVQCRREPGLDAPVFVAKVAGADDAPLGVLNLQHRQPGEAHRRARVVEQVVPILFEAGNRPGSEAIVVHQRALERREAFGDCRTLAREIFADDLDDAIDAALVFL